MSEMSINGKGFVGYEYSDVTVNRTVESLYLDSYPAYGWEYEGKALSLNNVSSVTMKFKRDRKVSNKAELTRLQRQFEALAKEIVTLERSKTFTAAIVAYGIGLLGTAFMAGSVFAFIAGFIPLCIILAIPAFMAWIVPYFSYVVLCRKKEQELNPLIEQKYDEIYEITEKANSLLV